MDKREKAKLSMYRSTAGFLSQPEVLTAVAAIPAIPLATAELTGSIELLEALDTEAGAAASGDNGNKAGLRALATATALVIDGKITAWAARRGALEVVAAFNHERSDFTRLGDEDFRSLLARVLAKAQELDTPPKQATEEGLTTGHVTTLAARAAAFRAVITRPEDLQKHEAALRQLIDAEFAKSDLLLDLRLDKLLRELSETQPALHTGYQSARIIYEAGSRSETPAPVVPAVPPTKPA